VRVFVAQRCRIVVAARPGGLRQDISMTAWTRIGSAAARARPEIMFFQDARAGFNNEPTWWAHFTDKN
jgi:hypothetical protein